MAAGGETGKAAGLEAEEVPVVEEARSFKDLVRRSWGSLQSAPLSRSIRLPSPRQMRPAAGRGEELPRARWSRQCR